MNNSTQSLINQLFNPSRAKITKKFEKIIEACQAEIKVNPKSFAANYLLGRALESLGRNQEAIEAYKKAVEINPTDLNALISLAYAMINWGPIKEGDNFYKQARELDPVTAEKLFHYKLFSRLD